jgi:tetratricopeptide (TPR) repeat protein
VRALKIILGEKDRQLLESIATPEVEAYEYYLRGRRLFHEVVYRYEESIKMFLRATQIDSTYALAYCGLADCYSWRYMYIEGSESNLIEAEKASRKAIAINPNLAEAHTSLGLAISLKKQYDVAEQQFESAIRLNPRLFEAHYFYGRMCFAQGKFEKAAQLYEEAVNVRPEDYQVPLLLASVYRSLHNEEKYTETNRSGLQKVERHLELHPRDARALYLGGGALLALGDIERGEQWIEQALHINPDGTDTLYNSACFYALAGKPEKAIDCLEGALDHGFAHKEWVEHDSDLDTIRANPRYQELLKRLK